MSNYRRICIPAALLATMGVVAGCSASAGGAGSGGNPTGTAPSGGGSTGYNAAYDHVVNPSTKTGGTLKLLSTGDCDSWDPQRTYYGWCMNLQRLFTRTLIGYKKVNGDKFELAPDLATAMGRHNKSYTQWTYTLKPGLKWENGRPITPLDIKYGIERLFATDVINGGPSSYFIDTVAHPKDYAGPYQDGDLNTIKTTKNSITFNLSTPYADFDYLMALPAAAPVPYKVENGQYKGATYTKHPLASGPYKIQSYTQNKQITFVRNPYWKQSTDTIRHPLVDKVVLTIDTNLDDIDQKLQAGTADARADNGVQVTFQSKILTDPTLKAHADDPATMLVRYIAIAPSVIPNVHCRLAIFYAFDKAGALRGLGGATNGVVAHSMTPPGIEGYEPGYNPYPSGPNETGDVAKAKQELKECGKPNGFSTKFAYNTPSTTAQNIFKAEQTALARVGIHISAATQDQSTYYSTFVGSPANIKNQGLGMMLYGWGPDFPTPVGFYNSIANGKNILPTGNSNVASLNDPVVNKVLDEAPSGKATEQDWRNLDHAIMKDAVYLPFVVGKVLYYRNPEMTNVTCDNALGFGVYDFVNAGVGG